MSRLNWRFLSNVPFTSNGKGAVCHYCQRTLEPTTSDSELAARKEHITPKHLGGRRRVWACKKCDVLKGSKSKRQWESFMRQFPQWWTWKIFKNER